MLYMEKDLKQRTKQFTLKVITLVEALPKTLVASVVGKQLLRSGSSVGANYRAACRARSVAEFIAKIGLVVEESDESCFWLEIIIDAHIIKEELVADLLKEANEITAIMVASSNSAHKRK